MNCADDMKIRTSDPNAQVVEEDINRDFANKLHCKRERRGSLKSISFVLQLVTFL